MSVWTCAIHGPTSTDCRGCDDELIALTEHAAENGEPFESDPRDCCPRCGGARRHRSPCVTPPAVTPAYLTDLAEQMDAADESDEARWAEIDAMDVEEDD